MVFISQKRKTAVFGKTQYVVRIAEHRIKFFIFHVNFGRNVAIDIMRNIIQFLYCSDAYCEYKGGKE